MTHWIVIADASGARIFATQGPNDPLELVRELDNAEGRLLTQELTSDTPGRVSKAGALGTRAATEPRTTAHEAAAEAFARQLAELLHREAGRRRYETLAIAAPPHFLGEFKTRLHRDVQRRLRATLARDLVRVSPDELPSHIGPLLEPSVFA